MSYMLKRIKNYLKIILIAFLAFLFLFPVLATVANSFMSQTEIVQQYSNLYADNEEPVRLSLIPAKVTIYQYYIVLVEKFQYINMFWNSVKLSVTITVLHVIVSILSAYVFAKVDFKGRDKLFFLYIVVMMMPFQVTLLPNYIQAKTFKILNTYWAIICPGVFAPFGVFLLRQFMKYIPDQMIEAITLESSRIRDILTIAIIPNAKPGIIALLVLNFTENWNMVEQPLVLLDDYLKHPLSLALNSIIESSVDIAFAGSVIYMIPIIILYFCFEDYILQGLSNMRF
ncbi:MAG: carbohydrate ABC transporter permease [Ruminiclostridium sp.]|nr:carbohydrate ABC transporter permease [Ruminiclostridium sp.]